MGKEKCWIASTFVINLIQKAYTRGYHNKAPHSDTCPMLCLLTGLCRWSYGVSNIKVY